MAGPARRQGNLPAETTSFIGRRQELAEIRKKLTTARLVSLVGPGGVGKSRLALRAATDFARRFPDGAWLVELADIRDPAMVGNAVMASLDLRDQAATEPLPLLLSYVRDKELLLVVDNCEHLLGTATQLVTEVLRAGPAVRVIATSREPLSAPGEHVVPVPPLDLPAGDETLDHLRQNEAVTLFTERAAAALGSFELTASNQAAVADLCRRLDGLPLAIELAAVRTRVLAPEQILDRLTDRFGLLTGGGRAALPRHQTLQTTIDWSYELLTADERMLMRRLCVFAGRYNLEDIEAVCTSDDLRSAQALDLLTSLVDKSLVIKEEVKGIACYRLHETMREYAGLKLREAGEEEEVEERRAEYYISRCQRSSEGARYRLIEWLEWMDLEIDNIRSVLGRCLARENHARGIELVSSLSWFWITRATTEGARWLDQLMDSDREPEAHAQAYFLRGFLAVLQADLGAARPTLRRAVAVAREAGQPVWLSHSLSMVSIAENMAGDRAAASLLLEQAEAVTNALDDLSTRLSILQARALNGFLAGNLEAVNSASSEGVRLSREANDLYTLEIWLMNLGLAALSAGELDESKPLLAEALRIAHDIDDRAAQFALVGSLGCHAAVSGESRRAAQLLGASEHLRAQVGANVNAIMVPLFSRAKGAATAALGPSKFDAEFERGTRHSRDAAIRLALEERARVAVEAARDDGSGALGKREADVARLVADGLSNKQIGTRLFISERTVESHVRSILNKLGFNSRAQIAGWIGRGRTNGAEA
jgi:predicted ATPase/DNA-binding CsgD family transcriptional regulator